MVDLLRKESPQLIKAIEKWLLSLFTIEDDQNEIMRIFGDIKKSTPMIETVVKRLMGNLREEVKEENQLETARKLKAAGIPVSVIVQCTDLTQEVVSKL